MANRLRETRLLKRITQFQLRILTGIHQSKISLIENGLIDPTQDEEKKLAKALGTKVEELFIDNTK
ncbi:transcriptional regulator [bacterium (candidate division B38) B3_B38]|nr:MAG: transcriptional regulator [bacterium (candidate division B38) B3_B38]